MAEFDNIRINYSGTKVEHISKLIKDPSSILKKIGTYLVKVTKQAFRDQRRGPNNWSPRRVPNIPGILNDLEKSSAVPMRRFTGEPVLVDTGQLSKSFTFRFQSKSAIIYGTKVPYANIHQLGGKTKIKMTQAMRKNLSILMKKSRRQAASMEKRGGPESVAASKFKKWSDANKGASHAQKREMKENFLKAENVKASRFDSVSQLGWLFSKHAGSVVVFNVKARPMVGVWKEDRAAMDAIIIHDFQSRAGTVE